MRNSGAKQLLIVFMAPILHKINLCICLIYFLFRIFLNEANTFANASEYTALNMIEICCCFCLNARVLHIFIYLFKPDE